MHRFDELHDTAATIVVDQAVDLGLNDRIDFVVENASGEDVDAAEKSGNSGGENGDVQRSQSRRRQPEFPGNALPGCHSAKL